MGDACALQLLVHNERTGKFELGEAALAKLRALRGPIGVVAVCGRARQGKSFILNQLLGRTNGFKVGPTQKPCTKGLWLWSEPVPMVARDGTHFHMCLLDCEGIDAYDQTGSYSVQLFSLAVLLSSLFVYNQMGGIDEAALERLQLIVEMTKVIKVRAGRGATSYASTVNDLASYTPTFFWLLRDFYLDLNEDGRPITPTQYLETALSAVPGHGEAIRSKNTIRESIKALFPQRECFTLVRPADEEATLRHLDSVPMGELRPQFVAGLQKLTSSVFANAAPKEMNGERLTGPVLAGLIAAYIDAINNGAVPTITTAWENVVELECRKASDAAEAAYEAAFDLTVGADEDALAHAHRRAVAAAQAAFEEVAFGDGPTRAAFEKRVQETIFARFTTIRNAKFAEAEAQVATALGMAAEQLGERVDREAATVEDLVEEMGRLVAAINASTAGGPQRYKTLTQFIDTHMGPLFIRAAQLERERHAVEKAEEVEEAERRARAEAEGLLEQELTKVVSEAESSAAVAAEEAYLGMLSDFVERIHTDDTTMTLTAEPMSVVRPVKLEGFRIAHTEAARGVTEGSALAPPPSSRLPFRLLSNSSTIGSPQASTQGNKTHVGQWVDSTASATATPAADTEKLVLSAGKNLNYASVESPGADSVASVATGRSSVARRPAPIALVSEW